MAKIKTQPDGEVAEAPAEEMQEVEVQETESVSAESTTKVPKASDLPKVLQKPQKEEPREKEKPELDRQLQDILKVHTTYESLYIDKQGGVFTEDTLAVIRKGAILYKNPFYKPY